MASLPATEDEYDFVEKPSEDFYCLVTFELLREPHLTECCGNHLSQEAVTRLQGQPCPVCKESSLNTMPDKYFKRKVSELKVHCPLGCDWVGELGSLDRHLNHNSVEGECQFMTMVCPYSCGDGFQRCRLDEHKANDCPNRPFSCKYCGHKATYISVTRDHWPICAKYRVDCPKKCLGCQWAGERGDLGQHLNDGSEEGECQFVAVACPHGCLRLFKRMNLQIHKTNYCPNRPFTCQYCNYKDIFNKVTNKHMAVCTKYPIECPNKCGEKAIERQHLRKHLEETCPLQVIKCEFSYAGCEVVCQRQHMQTHLGKNVKVHLNKLSQHTICLQSTTQQQQSIIEQLQNVTQQQQKQIVALMSALALNVQKPLVPVFIPPPDIVMTDFEKHKKTGDKWYSPSFYSHIGGYKMCLRVDAFGNGGGKATHISAFCYLTRGEYDDQLKWPFRGDITIQLLNQSSDEGHRERFVHFDDTVGNEYAGRVVGKERATQGWGQQKFTAHTELNTENKEYLKNDCLKFRISRFVVKST